MRTSEILDLAADKIQQQGWTKGSAGWPGIPEHKGEGSKLCLEGGIMAAMGVVWDPGSGREVFTHCPAYAAVQEYLEWGPLYAWNDSYATGEAQVIEVLRAAAAVERAKEESLVNQKVDA